MFNNMKKLILLSIVLLSVSCSVFQPAADILPEDQLFITRKYVGSYIDYKHTSPVDFAGPHVIWIKTTADSTYGKISAYGKNCEFTAGDLLYLRRVYYQPGSVFGYWIYQIENNNDSSYRIREFQDDKKVLVQTWF